MKKRIAMHDLVANKNDVDIAKFNSATKEIHLNGFVDAYGKINYSFIQEALEKMNGEEVSICLNSPGGDVFEGIAIANLIDTYANKQNKITVYVYGAAASIASVIACAASKVVMMPGSMLMIHNPWSYVAGNAQDLRAEADILDKIKEQILVYYRKKTGKNAEELSQLMDAETWFTPDEALNAKLCDEIASENDNKEDSAKNQYMNERMAVTKTLRNVEQILHRIGFSKNQSKVAASAVFDALKQRDAVSVSAEMSEKLKNALEARNVFGK